MSNIIIMVLTVLLLSKAETVLSVTSATMLIIEMYDSDFLNVNVLKVCCFEGVLDS